MKHHTITHTPGSAPKQPTAATPPPTTTQPTPVHTAIQLLKTAHTRHPRTPWQQLLRRARALKQASITITPRPDRRHRYSLCHTCEHNRNNTSQPRPAWLIDCARRPCGYCQGIEPWQQRTRCPASKW